VGMSAFSAHDSAGARNALPPLAAEDYACASCALDYSKISIPHATDVVQTIPTAVRDAALAVPDPARR
jgi:hypothetical protein